MTALSPSHPTLSTFKGRPIVTPGVRPSAEPGFWGALLQAVYRMLRIDPAGMRVSEMRTREKGIAERKIATRDDRGYQPADEDHYGKRR